MDAKVLRAAVSAAIRVTVSTTLIGCGGNVTSEAGGAAGASTGGVATSTGGPSKGLGEKATTPYPTPNGTPAAGGSEAATGGTGALGGQPTGGMASAGTAAQNDGGTSDGGEPSTASGGAPADLCACKALLTDVKAGEALSSEAKVCCQAVIDVYLTEVVTRQACWADFSWFSLPAHQQCCTTLDAWQQPACTPWGPPVPPEAPLAALLNWELAA